LDERYQSIDSPLSRELAFDQVNNGSQKNPPQDLNDKIPPQIFLNSQKTIGWLLFHTPRVTLCILPIFQKNLLKTARHHVLTCPSRNHMDVGRRQTVVFRRSGRDAA
jgi:hypothetical protein